MMGSEAGGLQGRISYAEFSQCGQPKILGRYCIHYHMAGAQPKSFVRGVAVHDSYARFIAIHKTDFILFEKNVGCSIFGHNVFLEEGV